MAARTLLQQAVPTTFGLKAAGWLVGAWCEARRRLLGVELQAQLGGARERWRCSATRGRRSLRAYAEELGLAEPVVPWHAHRAPVVELGAALDAAAGAAGKIGLDVVLLAQDEVGEVRAGDAGGSSTMPHKRNPVGAVLARACARRVHALVATFALDHEHERAAGAWQAEWEALSDALASTGGAAAAIRGTLERLEVDAGRMSANMRHGDDGRGGEAGGEPRQPEDYLGAAGEFVERALALYRTELA